MNVIDKYQIFFEISINDLLLNSVDQFIATALLIKIYQEAIVSDLKIRNLLK